MQELSDAVQKLSVTVQKLSISAQKLPDSGHCVTIFSRKLLMVFFENIYLCGDFGVTIPLSTDAQ
jgi:hypothetical protein